MGVLGFSFVSFHTSLKLYFLFPCGIVSCLFRGLRMSAESFIAAFSLMKR